MSKGTPLERMRAAGELEPAIEDPDDPEPLILSPELETPSSVLRRLRSDER